MSVRSVSQSRWRKAFHGAWLVQVKSREHIVASLLVVTVNLNNEQRRHYCFVKSLAERITISNNGSRQLGDRVNGPHNHCVKCARVCKLSSFWRRLQMRRIQQSFAFGTRSHMKILRFCWRKFGFNFRMRFVVRDLGEHGAAPYLLNASFSCKSARRQP